jgi:hypothetical protein
MTVQAQSTSSVSPAIRNITLKMSPPGRPSTVRSRCSFKVRAAPGNGRAADPATTLSSDSRVRVDGALGATGSPLSFGLQY